jgi:cytochrome c556
MKFWKITALALSLAGFTALAQDDAEFQNWMKATGQANGVLRKANPKTGPEVVAAAEKLGGIYENMIGFWRQRNAADAVKSSEEGKAAAAALAAAAKAGDADKANSAAGALGATCKGCHSAHREQIGENKYKIK